MGSWLRIFLIVFAVLFMQSVGSSGDQMIVPDPQIQTQINRIISIANTTGNKEEMLGEMAKLKGMGTTEHLLQQLIYFRTNAIKSFNAGKITSNEMENAREIVLYTIGTLLTPADTSFEKISSPSAQTLIRAIVPYLGTEDPDLKKELYRMLKMVDLNVSGRQVHPKYSEYPVAYVEYKLFIETNKDNLSEPLVQYMYQKSPGEALLTLTKVYIDDPQERNTIIHAEDVIKEDFWKRYHGPVKSRPRTISPEAKQAIDQLSRYPQWWIQLYVAEILLREPQFSSPQILERLKDTKHPVVLKTLEKITGK